MNEKQTHPISSPNAKNPKKHALYRNRVKYRLLVKAGDIYNG